MTIILYRKVQKKVRTSFFLGRFVNKFSGNENVAYLWYNKITCNGYENNLSSIISLVFVFYSILY